MQSRIDYVFREKEKTSLLINYNKYDSDSLDWVSIETLFLNNDFIDLLFIKLTGKKVMKKAREILLKSLMITSMGVGSEPPSVFVPKTVASTTKDKRFAMINGMIAGLATFGTHHLGAVYDVMKMYSELKYADYDKIEEYVDIKLNKKEIIFGFGHPAYNKDPRPKLLFRLLEKSFEGTIIFENYKKLVKILHEKKRISPNIDAIVGLSYSCLGFEPEHSLYLSFFSRSLNMVCHIFEELENKPFSFFIGNSGVKDVINKV